MPSKALPERYRQASNIHAGYEIRTTDGQWLRVAHSLRIHAPANIVTFTFDEGGVFTTIPTDQIMSRRLAGAA